MKTRIVGIMMAVLLIGGLFAKAEEPQGWQFEITPYMWLAGLDGDITVRGNTVEFSQSFSDLIDNVDLAGSLLGVAQYDRYVILGQIDSFALSEDNVEIKDKSDDGKLEANMFLGEAVVGYQIDGWAEGQTFDLLVGARTLRMKTDLSVGGVDLSDNEQTIVDPIFLVRPSIPIYPSKIQGLRFNPTLGIGAGGDSKLVYELFPQFQYEIKKNVVARIGYRRVGYKFDGKINEDNEMNVALAGMVVGVGVTF